MIVKETLGKEGFKLRVCMVAPYLMYPKTLGGLVHQIELSKALVSRGHVVHLITQGVGSFKADAMVPNLFLHEIRVPELPLWIKLNLINARFLFHVARLCRQERFDLIHDRGYLFGGVGTLVAALIGLPVVFQVDANWVDDAYLHLIYRSRFQQIVSGRIGLPLAKWWLTRVILPRTTFVIAVSQALARVVCREWKAPKSKVFIIPNAADVKRFHPSVNGSEVLMKFGLRGRRVIAFVGEIAPWHGVDRLIESMRLISSKDEAARLLLVGGVHPTYLGRLKRLIRDLGLTEKAIFTGVRPYSEIPSIVSASDVAVAPFIPSNKSGFSPLKVFEYMAAGKPTVATRVPYIEEILQDGVDALLVDPSNPEKLAEAILKILNDKRLSERLGASAREKVSKSFTWERVAEKIEYVYSRVLNAWSSREG